MIADKKKLLLGVVPIACIVVIVIYFMNDRGLDRIRQDETPFSVSETVLPRGNVVVPENPQEENYNQVSEVEDNSQSLQKSISQISLFNKFSEFSSPQSRETIPTPASFFEYIAPSIVRNTQIGKPKDAAELSESEMLDLIWPAEYRKSLKAVQDLMLQDGFVMADKASDLSTETEMYQFFNDMNAYALHKEWITKEQFVAFSRGIAVELTQTVEAEKQLYRSGKSRAASISENHLLSQKMETKKMVRGLWDGVARAMFIARPANAAYVPGEVFCYKDDNPADITMGYNIFATCCNCGLFCSYGCSFVQNCGPYALACTVDLGCLNLMCTGKLNAIWDPTTGICGCG